MSSDAAASNETVSSDLPLVNPLVESAYSEGADSTMNDIPTICISPNSKINVDSTVSSDICSSAPTTNQSSVVTTVNGVSGRIVQIPGANTNSQSIAYVGTLIKKGKDVVPQKVLLTPVRSKDGAITRFILPKTVAPSPKINQVRVTSTPPTKVGNTVQSNPLSGFIVSPAPFSKSLGRSFVIHSNCGPTSVKSTSLLKNINDIHRSGARPKSSSLPVKSKHAESKLHSNLPLSQMIPKPLPPATAPSSSPFPNTLPPAKTFEHKDMISVNSSLPSDVTITSVSLPASVVSPITPLSVTSKPPLEVPPLTPFNLPSVCTTSASAGTNKSEIHSPEKLMEVQPDVEIIPNGNRIAEAPKHILLNGYAVGSSTPCTITISAEDFDSPKKETSTMETNKSPVLLTSPLDSVEFKTDDKLVVNSFEKPTLVETQSDSFLKESREICPNLKVIDDLIKANDPLAPSLPENSLPEEMEEEKPKTFSSNSTPFPSNSESQCESPPKLLSSPILLGEEIAVKPEPRDFPNNIVIVGPKSSSVASLPGPKGLTSAFSAPAPSPKLHTTPHYVTAARQPYLQVKELSKEQFMLERKVLERARKRKGSLVRDCFKKTIAVKRLEPLPGATDVDPLQVIEWDQESGMGKMPGTDILFIMNTYGGLQVYEKNGSAYETFGKLNNSVEVKPKQNKKDDICRCIQCQCYGLVAEFVDEKYCSLLCKDDYLTRKALIKKRDFQNDDENTIKKRKIFQMALQLKNGSSGTADKVEGEDDKPLVNLLQSVPEPVEMKPSQEMEVIELDDDEEDEKLSLLQKPLPDVLPEEEVPEEDLWKSKTKCLKPVPTIKLIPKKFAATFSKSPKVDPKPEKKGPKLKVDRISAELKALIKTSDETLENNNNTPDISPVTSSKCVSPEMICPPAVEENLAAFDWNDYLEKTRSTPAWVRLFQNPYPTEMNSFKVGHRLEAIDPQRQSLFCVVSVAEVKGYRIKLHFDGYPKCHDFWVNADSPNIFPCGFCSNHKINLQPPYGFKKDFDWNTYLISIGAKSAPSRCFIHKHMNTNSPNRFKVGMKLEAVDRKNSYLICVATVAVVLDHRILIHFDSWDEVYDYWTDVTSPNIHPVGWCAANQHQLTPPNGWKKRVFSWHKYLEETGTVAAPEAAFMLRPALRFKRGTKLEAVDPRAPHLVRVATIKQVLPYQVNIVFDGFPDHFGSWFEDDCVDLHPVGWCRRTGHFLSSPPGEDAESRCQTGGCMGDGHSLGTEFESHSVTTVCPYSVLNMDNDQLPDRLSHKPDPFDKKASTSSKSSEKIAATGSRKKSKDASSDSECRILIPYVKIEEYVRKEADESFASDISCEEIQEEMIKEIKTEQEDVPEDQEEVVEEVIKEVVEEYDIGDLDIMLWDISTLSDYVEKVVGHITDDFIEHKLDGEGFLMLAEEEIISVLKFTKAEASKLTSLIFRFRSKF